MKAFLKKHGSILYIAVASLVVLLVVLNSSELPEALVALKRLDLRWLWACGALVACYLTARMLTLHYYLRRQGVNVRLRDSAVIVGVGEFYSAITPSASGGQPMQVLTMHRMGIPLSKATASLSVSFVGFQCAFLCIGLALWVAYWPMVTRQLWGIRWLVVVGYGINLALIVGVVLTMFRSRWIGRALSWLIRQGGKLHLIRDEEKTCQKAREVLEDYQGALRSLLAQPLDALVVFVLSCLQILLLMSVPGCLYKAFGLSGWTGAELLTLQLLLFIAAAFVPLPGAAGAQEGGFYLFFRGIFPEGDILAAMLCWRLFSYYLLMIVGLMAVVADGVSGYLHRRSEHA